MKNWGDLSLSLVNTVLVGGKIDSQCSFLGKPCTFFLSGLLCLGSSTYAEIPNQCCCLMCPIFPDMLVLYPLTCPKFFFQLNLNSLLPPF
jgi:hypothetical protein